MSASAPNNAALQVCGVALERHNGGVCDYWTGALGVLGVYIGATYEDGQLTGLWQGHVGHLTASELANPSDVAEELTERCEAIYAALHERRERKWGFTRGGER